VARAGAAARARPGASEPERRSASGVREHRARAAGGGGSGAVRAGVWTAPGSGAQAAGGAREPSGRC
jgi:hypothetical protein